MAEERTPGRFFLGAEGEGIFWERMFTGSVRRVAVDSAQPRRVAAGFADGMVLSLYGGKTWEALNRRPPYRVFDRVCFAGDRLLAGSSGAFWLPLSAAGERPARSGPPARQRAGVSGRCATVV